MYNYALKCTLNHRGRKRPERVLAVSGIYQNFHNQLSTYTRQSSSVFTKNVSYIDFRLNTPSSLALPVAGRNTLGGESLWYRTDFGTVHCTDCVVGAVYYSHLPVRPAARQIFSYKGDLRLWGIAYVYVWL